MQTGRKILNLRYDRKINQQELAAACDITPSALSKIEAGRNKPGAGVIWNIARALGVSVEYLMDEDIPYPYPGDTYRHELLESGANPTATVNAELSLEEHAFIEALRKVHRVAQEVAFAIPGASLETIRLIHFVINHAKIENPSQRFLADFESLLTTGEPAGAAGTPPRAAPERKANGRRKASRGKKKSSRKSASRPRRPSAKEPPAKGDRARPARGKESTRSRRDRHRS